MNNTGIANSPDNDCELFLTARENPSICAALPRSSNGKTTDSDSGPERLPAPIVRKSVPVCSPRKAAALEADCELSNADLIAELSRFAESMEHLGGEFEAILNDNIEKPYES